jgi:hypothetical protein
MCRHSTQKGMTVPDSVVCDETQCNANANASNDDYEILGQEQSWTDRAIQGPGVCIAEGAYERWSDSGSGLVRSIGLESLVEARDMPGGAG